MSARLATLARVIPVLVFALAVRAADADEAEEFVVSDSLKLTQIEPGVWLHTSYTILAGHPFPSNGLLVAVDDGLIMVDTAWSEKDTRDLLAWVDTHLEQEILVTLVTHSHDDRMIGLPEVHAAGIPSMALDMTVAKAREQGRDEPRGQFRAALGEHDSGRDWTLFYPGPGHTDDNIVVFFPERKLLFGGCLVKANSAEGMGYVVEADLDNWGNAINAVAKRFPDARLLVPGHGEPGGRGLLSHTLTLLDIHNSANHE